MGKASAEVSPKASKKEREAAETKPGVGIPIKALAVGGIRYHG